ncbi:Cof-type HAD-IIB family hydrolase [Deinococcus sp. KNUC1210]|uniref:Cof-type HAD-IIB family hydrolase n=1 Tax=Deinococcus sp. KNUC1210 TaxID=2917691 RepID=UPI001EF0BF73|nr:HAD family hydrolase [Deinococcus sp. KNUC1210]ULH15475.1 Cof-type HAD-IIB family hydrolase [Deinococcus sp. KNUC1210]
MKLIATDLDGTLLNSAGEVSARSRATLQRAQQAGLVVVLITGRPSRMVLPLAEHLGLQGHIICSNGAATHRLPDGTAEDLQPIPAQVLHTLIPRLRAELPDVSLALEWGSGMAREQDVPDVTHAAEARGAAQPSPELLSLLDSQPILKLIARSAALDPLALNTRINALGAGSVHASSSGAPFSEVAASHVSKAYALERLCGLLGVAARDVVVFGDAPNDLPMMTWAGRAVAVANAQPVVQQTADEVTLSNDQDGVAAYLERYLDELEQRP